MECPRCRQWNRADARYCDECGTPLDVIGGPRGPGPADRDVASVPSEASGQQRATNALLRAISRTTTDARPIFQTIAEEAALLCNAPRCLVFRVESEMIEVMAGTHPDGVAFYRERGPTPVSSPTLGGQVVRERRIVHVPNAFEDPDVPDANRDLARRRNTPAFLLVPIGRDMAVQGVILAGRHDPLPFSDSEVSLVASFADQAAIAIENVRLLVALEEKNRMLTSSLAHQTATSEILRLTSESLTDARPTFDAIAVNAVRLCDAVNGFVFRYDGALIDIAAYHNVGGDELDAIRRVFPIPPGRGSVTARAILTGAIAHVADLSADPEYAYTPIAQAGFRTVLAVPMLRDGIPLGAIVVTRMRVAPFSPGQIELLQTFARQAVIAVEAVRLFQELQARTRDLGRSVEELRALGEVGRAVGSTLDLDTVLETIIARAVQLSGGDGGSIFEYDVATEEFSLLASNDIEEVVAGRGARLRKGEGAVGRTALTREPVQIADMRAPGAYEGRLRDDLVRAGRRALLAVPLLREQAVIGALVISRNAVGLFPPSIVELLRTFATQSALAIQNARLFKEIEDKSRQLDAASQQKSAFLANMSHELRTPLNAIIGYSELLEEEAGDVDGGRLVADLQKIAAAAKHQLALINDVLDLSKIEAGRTELEPTDFELASVVESALTLIGERAARRGITLDRAIDDRVGIVRGDERKVKQVLLNLLSNALKFTPEGGRVAVRAARRDGGVEVAVSDTGVGIAPEDQEAIFEEFRQVGAADRKAEGTGLGLALARKLIELHGGRMWVTSRLGEGATFTFTLPAAGD